MSGSGKAALEQTIPSLDSLLSLSLPSPSVYMPAYICTDLRPNIQRVQYVFSCSLNSDFLLLVSLSVVRISSNRQHLEFSLRWWLLHDEVMFPFVDRKEKTMCLYFSRSWCEEQEAFLRGWLEHCFVSFRCLLEGRKERSGLSQRSENRFSSRRRNLTNQC